MILIIIIYITLLLILLLYIWPINKQTKEKFDIDISKQNLNNNLHSDLVFTSAGDNTHFYDYWCDNKTKAYDIWLVYYGDNEDNYNKYKKYVNKIWKRKGTKFQNFDYIYKKELPTISQYDRVFIMDDDIIIKTNDINKMFDISKQYNLWICQPSYTNDSKISHAITKNQPNNILRYTNFIEVGVPLFSKESLNKFMSNYNPKLVEWGVDYLFIWSNGKDIKDKYAIIDSIKCKNPYDEEKKITKREIDNVKEHKKSPQIWYDYAMKIGAPYDWPHVTYEEINNIITLSNKDVILSRSLTKNDINNIKAGQTKMLNMMKEFHKICVNNNIQYMLSGGSLLGTILYNGWIPWDGDFDLYIYEDDYDKLKKALINNLPKTMWFLDYLTEPNYKNKEMSKVKDLNSCYYSYEDISLHNGLQIDIVKFRFINNIFTTFDNMFKTITYNDVYPLRLHKFEDTEFYVPNNYIKFLNEQFGKNWTTILPIEKRIPHEGLMDPHNPCAHHKKLYPLLYK
jgi:phosphorylcholine metabolism protein LicD